jgi:hypothetical protein
MKDRISENKILKEMFRGAYFSREKGISSDRWPRQVMTCIRQIGPLAPVAGFWTSIEPIVWRLAPVNVVLIVVLLLVSMSFDTGYDYLGSSVAGLDRPSLSEFFGLEG